MNGEDFNESVQRAREACTPAERTADLELSQVRVELEALRKELLEEGWKRTDEEFGRVQVENLEERLARLYCAYYELRDGVED